MVSWLAPLLATVGLSAPCEEPIDAATLESRALAVEQAWADMDRAGFVEQATALEALLPCVEDALYPDQLASYFRIRGMRAFFDGDRIVAVEAWQAALALQPGYELPEEQAGEDHPLRELVESARSRPTGWRTLEDPAEGWLQVDGAISQRAPRHRSWVFQRFTAEGTVVETARVDPPNDPPAYPQRLLGAVVAGLGLSGMMAGIPIANVAIARERALLSEYGAVPRTRTVAWSWGLYAATLAAGVGVAVVAPFERGFATVNVAMVGVLCWPTSAVLSTLAASENRRWMRQERARGRTRLAVLPARHGAALGLVVPGW